MCQPTHYYRWATLCASPRERLTSVVPAIRSSGVISSVQPSPVEAQHLLRWPEVRKTPTVGIDAEGMQEITHVKRGERVSRSENLG